MVVAMAKGPRTRVVVVMMVVVVMVMRMVVVMRLRVVVVVTTRRAMLTTQLLRMKVDVLNPVENRNQSEKFDEKKFVGIVLRGDGLWGWASQKTPLKSLSSRWRVVVDESSESLSRKISMSRAQSGLGTTCVSVRSIGTQCSCGNGTVKLKHERPSVYDAVSSVSSIVGCHDFCWKSCDALVMFAPSHVFACSEALNVKRRGTS